jgi:hypothetical protein
MYEYSINIKLNCDPQFLTNIGSTKLGHDVINYVSSNCGPQMWTAGGDVCSFLRQTTKSPEIALQ